MKFKNPLLAVTDMEKSKSFYFQVLGLRVTADFGANVTLTGGVCLQTLDSWREFIGASEQDIIFRSKNAELYFEEDDFDSFINRLEQMDNIEYVHPVKEHSWGQRAVRIYDPDKHIIEIGENLKSVCLRFIDSGMSQQQTAERMDVPLKFVKACTRVRQKLHPAD